MENKMNFEFRKNDIIVKFYGEVDCLNVVYYRHQLNQLFEKYDENVIFDFSNMTFIDSSGIGLVLGRYNQLKFDGRYLKLVGLNHVSYKLFELSGLFQIMPYFKTIDEAIEEKENERDNGNNI